MNAPADDPLSPDMLRLYAQALHLAPRVALDKTMPTSARLDAAFLILRLAGFTAEAAAERCVAGDLGGERSQGAR
jgi:hypothetical protein